MDFTRKGLVTIFLAPYIALLDANNNAKISLTGGGGENGDIC